MLILNWRIVNSPPTPLHSISYKKIFSWKVDYCPPCLAPEPLPGPLVKLRTSLPTATCRHVRYITNWTLFNIIIWSSKFFYMVWWTHHTSCFYLRQTQLRHLDYIWVVYFCIWILYVGVVCLCRLCIFVFGFCMGVVCLHQLMSLQQDGGQGIV